MKRIVLLLVANAAFAQPANIEKSIGEFVLMVAHQLEAEADATDAAARAVETVATTDDKNLRSMVSGILQKALRERATNTRSLAQRMKRHPLAGGASATK